LTEAARSQRAVPSSLLTVAALLLAVLLWALREILLLVGYAIILAYLLDPLVSLLQRIPLGRGRHLPRAATSAIVVLSLVGAAGAALALGLPRLVQESVRFAQRAPDVVEQISVNLRAFATRQGLGQLVDPVADYVRSNSTLLLQQGGGSILGWIGRAFGGLGQILGLLLLPLLAYYLLAESQAVQESVLRFVPQRAHARLATLMGAVDRALRSYVRGQISVCFIMGVSVGFVLALLGFPYSVLLGVMVALAELVPYLGFWIAASAIILSGYAHGGWFWLIGLAVYAVVNNVVGTLVTPRVMGRYLKMHPFVVTVSVLAGGTLLGPPGVLLALPMAAVVQAVVAELTGPRKPAGRD
jgi:predicted PurR-regulated permease PerM